MKQRVHHGLGRVKQRQQLHVDRARREDYDEPRRVPQGPAIQRLDQSHGDNHQQRDPGRKRHRRRGREIGVRPRAGRQWNRLRRGNQHGPEHRAAGGDARQAQGRSHRRCRDGGRARCAAGRQDDRRSDGTAADLIHLHAECARIAGARNEGRRSGHREDQSGLQGTRRSRDGYLLHIVGCAARGERHPVDGEVEIGLGQFRRPGAPEPDRARPFGAAVETGQRDAGLMRSPDEIPVSLTFGRIEARGGRWQRCDGEPRVRLHRVREDQANRTREGAEQRGRNGTGDRADHAEWPGQGRGMVDRGNGASIHKRRARTTCPVQLIPATESRWGCSGVRDQWTRRSQSFALPPLYTSNLRRSRFIFHLKYRYLNSARG